MVKAEPLNLQQTVEVTPQTETSPYGYMAIGAMGGAALVGGLLYANNKKSKSADAFSRDGTN